ncbi:regulator of chromosome condensation 1/beta-lactamase-inhibitor protein II, partial [Phyllosticta capitalensis]|uniref:regulator of chromosome condensation 1/beta-lactamase-inhibitor protein II n=1 Tax=Phyllosticta capitalensis TaxID=121624 RepID=UPI00312F3FD6
PGTPLTERSKDIVLLVVQHLDARSFLALARTCRGFYQESFRLDPVYWSQATRRAFRLPNQPAVELNGRLWSSLYRRLLTQTHVFTWGNNDHGALGQDEPIPHRAYPSEMVGSKELGTIADMQCGGWSTTLLTSRGALHTAGTIGNEFVGGNNLQPLAYPPGYPKPTERHDDVVTIRQFSAGRAHILALSDSGRIWSWYSIKEPCRRITFLHVDLTTTRSASRNHDERGIVRKVVAGWNASSAYINGSGIILWKPHGRNSNAINDRTADTVEIAESIQVPKTTYTRPFRNTYREPDEATAELGLNVGEVVNHIVLEHFVIFVTDIGKFFAARFEWDDEGNGGTCAGVVELAALSTVPDKKQKVDIQGSFRSFAAFTHGGEVITGTQDYLNSCFERGPNNADIDGLKRIPALQKTGVISVAFGDHHYHALKKDGSILSFGRESQACGSLGLGGEGEAEKRLRGQYYDRQRTDVLLVQHVYTTGRQVWFDEVKRKWITYLMSGGYDPLEAQPRIRLTADPYGRAMGEVSEWIEQQGRDWDKHPEFAHVNEDGLGSHFALTVAAAGWHSGAVVLVNEELAKRINPSEFVDPINHGASPGPHLWYRWADHHFPRIVLSDGTELPGSVPLDQWKGGVRPEWVLDQEFS